MIPKKENHQELRDMVRRMCRRTEFGSKMSQHGNGDTRQVEVNCEHGAIAWKRIRVAVFLWKDRTLFSLWHWNVTPNWWQMRIKQLEGHEATTTSPNIVCGVFFQYFSQIAGCAINYNLLYTVVFIQFFCIRRIVNEKFTDAVYPPQTNS